MPVSGVTSKDDASKRGASKRGAADENVGQKSVRIKATNLLDLRKQVGKTITAYGRVEEIRSSKSGHRFVNFVGGQLSAICRKENAASFRGEQDLSRFRGKDVELTGKLNQYQGTFPQDNPIFSREAGQAGWECLLRERLEGFLEPPISQDAE